MKPVQLGRYQNELHSLNEKSRLRSLPKQSESSIIDLSTNSYLALEQNESLQQHFDKQLKQCAGNGASRLVKSSSKYFENLEETIAEWKKCEAALVFNSGFAANTGIIQALATRATEIFSDRLNHASIVDGITLSRAKSTRYHHCDMDDLQKRLERSTAKEKIIITDALFSMDGDIAPLSALAQLANKYEALLIVDEAHSTGIFGESGNGLLSQLEIEGDNIISVGTFSKAVCGMGGFFAGSSLIKEYLINKCRSLIFSTALPESTLLWNALAIAEIQNNPNVGKQLLLTAKEFREKLKQSGIDTGLSESHIIPIICNEDKIALHLSKHLLEKGFRCPAIRPPTVPEGSSRVRVSLHAGITKKELEKLFDAITRFFHE